MKITDLLDYGRILLNATPASKEEAIDRLTEVMAASGTLWDKERYQRQVYLREKEGTTGIGEGVAIPQGEREAGPVNFLMGLGIRQGEEILVQAEGEDETQAQEEVREFLTKNL